ncbi:plasmid stability protein/3-polyprenyl-4-hydroxybenzoate decarboxylase [Bradyrhizobium sp. LM3.4]
MASLTIRKLDENVKTFLRLRSARNRRSVEEEVRVILGELIEGREEPLTPFTAPPAASATPIPQRPGALPEAGVTLIIGGGIAAYKSLDLIRRLKERRIEVRCVLTKAAQQFVTPLAVSALSHERVYTDLFDPQSEFDAGHIRLARECDLIVVAPATADLMAKMANGHADDLASAILLATNRKVLLAPAMNPLMWNNAATRRNVAQLQRDGVVLIGPNSGEMAEAGEAGIGRMSEAIEIATAAERLLRPPVPRPLAGKRVLITARSDSRADRPGALHRQPLLRQAGLCHRRRRTGRRRRGDFGERTGRSRRSPGRDGQARGIGAADAGAGAGRASRRHCDLRRGSRRLAGRQ